MYVIYAVLLKHLCKLTPCRIKNTLESTTSSQVGDGAASAAVRVRSLASLGAIVEKMRQTARDRILLCPSSDAGRPIGYDLTC